MSVKFLNKNYLLAVSLSATIYVASNMFITAMPKYAVDLHQSKLTAGLLMLVYTLSACFSRIKWGKLADKHGRTKVIYTGIALNIVASALMFFKGNMAIAFISRGMLGSGFSAAITAGSTLSTEVVAPQHVPQAVAIYGLGGVLTQAIAPPLALFLYNYGMTTIAATSIALLVASFLMCKGINAKPCGADPQNNDQNSKKDTLSCENQKVTRNTSNCDSHSASKSTSTCDNQGEKEFDSSKKEKGDKLSQNPSITPSIVAGIITFSTAGVLSFVSLLPQERAVQGVSGFFVANAIGLLASRLLFTKISEKLSQNKLFFIGIAIFITGFLLLAFADNQIALTGSGFLYGYGLGSVHPILNTQAISGTSCDNRAKAMGIFYASQDMGVAAGSIACGFLADIYTLQTVFLLCGGVSVLAEIVYFFKRKPCQS